ncbi:MAG: DUF6691 family protein, partial [SAR324 cluster bacterium]|nr:DUF6691 family protein [SAR324 cluster bacterium]
TFTCGYGYVYGGRNGDGGPCSTPLSLRTKMAKSNIAAFLCGLLFSIGLGISGMTQPHKVIGFLDVFGEWDLSLAFVMGGAVISYLLLQLWIQRRFSTPMLGEKFQFPSRKDLDRSLIFGALLFGLGWGLGGYCPGPAITSLGSVSLNALLFVVAMGMGMLLADRVISPILTHQALKN